MNSMPQPPARKTRTGAPAAKKKPARSGPRLTPRSSADSPAKPAPKSSTRPSPASAKAKPAAASAKPRLTPPGTAKPRAAAPAAATGATTPKLAYTIPKVSWSGLREMYDFWGNQMKRYFQLETLARSVEHSLIQRRPFILESIHEVLGPTPLTSLHVELFQEGRYQLIFRMTATNQKRKTASFGLVVAKNHEECSEVAKEEHMNLRTLHARAPRFVVQPYRGGTFYLPDRHKRAGHERYVYAYVTGWLPGYEELGVARSLQFIVNIEKRHTFSLAETEELKGIMLEIIASTYDAKSRTCMTMPQIASGDFVVSRAGGVLKLKLIACRQIQHRMSHERLLSQVLTMSWDWGGRQFKLSPQSPETVVDALTRVWGADYARKVVLDYLDSVAKGKLAGKKPEYLVALRAACDA